MILLQASNLVEACSVAIKLEILLPFIVGIIGALTGLLLVASEIKRRQAETTDREASTAERFVNAAGVLADHWSEIAKTLKVTAKSQDGRITLLETQMANLSNELEESRDYLQILLSLIDLLLSGVETLSEQACDNNQTPTFNLDDERLEIVGKIRSFVEGRPGHTPT